MPAIVKKMHFIPAAHCQEEKGTVSPDRYWGMEGEMGKTGIMIKLILNFLNQLLLRTCLHEQNCTD